MNNIWLFVMVQSVSACVIGWFGIAIIMISGNISGWSIGLSIAAGFVLAFPVAWYVVKRMTSGPKAP